MVIDRTVDGVHTTTDAIHPTHSVVTGWRYWVVETDAPALLSPMRNRMWTGHTLDVWRNGSVRDATCRSGTGHQSPTSDCPCGFRVVERLLDVLLWIQHYYSTYAQRNVPAHCPPLLVARVQGEGLILPGVSDEQAAQGMDPDGADPDNTWRVERVRLREGYLSPASASVATQLRSQLGIGLQVAPAHWCLLTWLNHLNDAA